MIRQKAHRESTTPIRSAKRLNPKLDTSLFAYAAAATAAGVGVLALAQPSEAKIIYTPAHVVLTGWPHSSYGIDLNHDGITDFSVTGGAQFAQSTTVAYLRCYPRAKPNMVWGRDSRSALPAGVKVGPHGIFNDRFPLMGFVGYRNGSGTFFRGPWVNGGKGIRNRYLGFKFVIKNKIHYGWARLNVTVQTHGVNLTATLTGYAYESIPNKPIITGKTIGVSDVASEPATPASLTNPLPGTATLGLLALGSPGHTVWRRKERTQPEQ